MRDSIFDWVRNLQHLILNNIDSAYSVKLQITRVDEVKENDNKLIEMTTNEFNHLSRTAEMLKRLMPGWVITVYIVSSEKCIIEAEKRKNIERLIYLSIFFVLKT